MTLADNDLPPSYMVGIDEAGRGPVLGPLVYAAAYCPVSHQNVLNELGLDDSKVLSPEERDRLLTVIDSSGFIEYELDVIDSFKISSSMLHNKKYNLNQISHDSAIGLIDRILAKGLLVQQVFVDTVGDPTSYQNKLSIRYPTIECVVRKKADSLFPIVSAASICAKTRRDAVIAGWVFKEELADIAFQREYGSGYPSDPKTKAWLIEHCSNVFGFPNFVRFSWTTCSVILRDRCCNVSWSDELEDDKEQTIAEFLSGPAQPKVIRKRNAFFHSDKHVFGRICSPLKG